MTLFANKKFTYTLFIIVRLSRVDCWRGISRCLGWIPEWTIRFPRNSSGGEKGNVNEELQYEYNDN